MAICGCLDMPDLLVLRIGDLAQGVRGVSYRPEHLLTHAQNDSFILLRSTNIQDGRLSYNAIQIVPSFLVKSEQKVVKGDLVVCMSNGSKTLVGKAARYDGSYGFSLTAGAFCSVFHPKDYRDGAFVFHVFQSDKFRREIDVILSGSAINNLRNKDIERIQIRPLERFSRWKISEILDAIDDAIIETDALIDKLHAIGNGMAADLFCFGLDSNGELRSPDMLADSAIGTIPSDWTVNRLDTIFGVFGGKRLPAGHNYALEATDFRYLRVTDFFSEVSRVEQLPSLEARTFKALQRYEIKDGSLAVSIAGSIGRFHPFRNETALSVILTENAARLEPKKSINPDFYARFLNSLPIQKQVELEIGTGGGVPKLALHRIQALKIVDVPRDEQDEISRRLDALDTEIEAYCIERDKLAALRNGLRDDLLTGRVSVERLTETATSPIQSGE